MIYVWQWSKEVGAGVKAAAPVLVARLCNRSLELLLEGGTANFSGSHTNNTPTHRIMLERVE